MFPLQAKPVHLHFARCRARHSGSPAFPAEGKSRSFGCLPAQPKMHPAIAEAF